MGPLITLDHKSAVVSLVGLYTAKLRNNLFGAARLHCYGIHLSFYLKPTFCNERLIRRVIELCVPMHYRGIIKEECWSVTCLYSPRFGKNHGRDASKSERTRCVVRVKKSP